jgi:hypothetical protein
MWIAKKEYEGIVRHNEHMEKILQEKKQQIEYLEPQIERLREEKTRHMDSILDQKENNLAVMKYMKQMLEGQITIIKSLKAMEREIFVIKRITSTPIPPPIRIDEQLQQPIIEPPVTPYISIPTKYKKKKEKHELNCPYCDRKFSGAIARHNRRLHILMKHPEKEVASLLEKDKSLNIKDNIPSIFDDVAKPPSVQEVMSKPRRKIIHKDYKEDEYGEILHNSITEQLKDSYQHIALHKKVVKEMSQILNETTQVVYNTEELKTFFKTHLLKHYDTVSTVRMRAYINYFTLNNQIRTIQKSTSGRKRLYEIIKNNIIPKNNKRRTFFDKLEKG